MLSKAELMKSANCISTTGRSPISAMPGRHAGEAQLGQRRVHHAQRAELGRQPLRDLERAAEVARDVLAHQEHVRVAAHLLGQRLVDRGEVGEVRGVGSAALGSICGESTVPSQT